MDIWTWVLETIYDHNFTGGYCLIEQKMRITHSRKKSPKYETNKVGLKRWRLWHLKAKMSTKHTYPICKLWGRVLPILSPAFLTTTGHSPAQVSFSRHGTRNRLLFMFLDLFFSAPLHFPHQVFFTTQWCVLLYLLKVGGKCNIIELVLFLLANKLACLEPNLSQSGAYSKLSRVRNRFRELCCDRQHPFPQMPTTTFKYEWYHVYPNFSISTWESEIFFLQLFTHPEYENQGTEQPHWEKEWQFLFRTTLQASNPRYLLMSKGITIFIGVLNNDRRSSLHNCQSWNSPASQ